ncbi:peptidoglycan DD-metalloendopeptidase family protein [Streptomyces sp. NPDC127098]|uniref:M23 family metallopeptidase n=1 Tax=Streptomyces sp. NPDC127098 TaxID=3347137 RepID=UPI003663C5CB
MSARGRHRRQRARARHISRISLMLSAGGAGIVLPLVASGTAHAASAETYEVKAGDTLYEIAAEHDVDGGWQALYEANRDVVGDDPRLITPGLELVLDEDAAVSTQSAPADQTAAEAPAGDYTAPVSGPLGTAYGVAGSMWSSGHHTGADFPVASGTPVAAITSGEVVSAGTVNSYGNEVIIRHDDGRYSQYAHLSSISVSAGQTVSTGDQIGLSGSTGNSTGPHLHFEVRTGPDYGSDIDPLAYLREHGVDI